MAKTPWRRSTIPLEVDAGVVHTEAATVPTAPIASEGTFWVRSDSPNVPMFTDDVGTDFVLNTSGGGASTGLPGNIYSNLQFYVDSADRNSYTPGTTTVTDLEGNGTAGTLSASSVYLDGAFNFTIAGQTLSFTKGAALDNIFAGGGTVLAFIRARDDGLSSAVGRIIDTSASGPPGGWFLFVDGYSNASVRPHFQRNYNTTDGAWRTNTITNPLTSATMGAVATGSWTSVAVTYTDGAGNVPTFYVNGLVAPNTQTAGPSVGTAETDAGNAIYIGNRSNGGATFDGQIGVVLQFDRILTVQEIQDIHNAFAPRYGMGMQGWHGPTGSGTVSGQNIRIVAGEAFSTGQAFGGEIYIQGGAHGSISSNEEAGGVFIAGGDNAGGGTTGGGGPILIRSGDGEVQANVVLRGGTVNANNVGSDVSVIGGSGSLGGFPGNVLVRGGASLVSNTNNRKQGNVTIRGGEAKTDGDGTTNTGIHGGGDATFRAGDGTNLDIGGSVTIRAGDRDVAFSGSNIDGGDVLVRGGLSDGTREGGILTLQGGGNFAGNAQGYVNIATRGTSGSPVSYVDEEDAIVQLSNYGSGTGGGSTIQQFVIESDPSAVSITANVGSVAFRNSGGTNTIGEIWLKTGAAGTAWTQVSTGGGGTWATVLATGATTGATNPILSSGQTFQGADTTGANAGVLALRGGNVTAGAGNAGGLTFTGGTAGTSGVAADLTFTAGAAGAGGGLEGGDFLFTSGAGDLAGSGGDFQYQGGIGGVTGDGGSFLVSCGDGGITSGTGGIISMVAGGVANVAGFAGTALLQGGPGTIATLAGGAATLQGGTGNTTGAGGTSTVQGGTPGANGIGGSVQILAANGGASAGNGGTTQIESGDGVASGTFGGSINLITGASVSAAGATSQFVAGTTNAGIGGGLVLQASDGTTGGGNNTIRSGSATVSGNAGNIVCEPGAGIDDDGYVNIDPDWTGDGSHYVQFSASGTNTANPTQFFTGNRNPNTFVTGYPGSLYLRGNSSTSAVYVNTTTGTSPGTTWSALSDVVGPASSTDDAVARWDGATGKLLQNSNAILTDAGALTLASSMTLDSASPTATIGNNAGSPIMRMLKSETGDSLFKFFSVDAAASAGDWQLGQNSLEAFILQYHDGAAFRTNIYTYDDRTILLLGDAQAAATITYGNAAAPANVTHRNYVGATGSAYWMADNGTNATQGGIQYNASNDSLAIRIANANNIFVVGTATYPAVDSALQLGLTTNRWTNVWADAGTFTDSVILDSATPFVTIGSGGGSPTAYLLKSDAGFGNFRFASIDTTESEGDWLLQHGSSESLILYRYDGTANRAIIASTDDTNLTLLGGAQGDATVSIGSAASTAYNGGIVLEAGATGVPHVSFADTGNQITYDHNAEDMVFWTQGVSRMVCDNRGLTVTLDVAGRQLIATGDSAGAAATTTFTNVVDTDIAGSAMPFTNDTGDTLEQSDWIKIYVGTEARYVPTFRVSS